MRVFRLPLLVASASLAATGCSKITQPDLSSNRYASLSVVARNNGSARATGSASVIFFQGINVVVPNSAQQQADQCIVTPVDTTTPLTVGQQAIGNPVAVSVGSTSLSFAYNVGFLRYEPPNSGAFTYNSGESVTVTVPSGSDVFPASTHTLKLAEPIIPGSLAVPAAGQDWVINWNGSNDNVSSVQLQLRYANPISSGFGNEQLFCVLKDDGTTTIPASALSLFLTSPSNRRSVRLLRWRTSQKLIDDRTLLHLSSTVDTVITYP